ncbi:hypothetical protein [Phenylobacterium sp. J367]|uniref:terminase small subunit-like protein n=1 Tax=Phenylobacterium sp. J367 TaxID=2898435 RepID=UPI0021513932|nr:hypothetical protein [Phenylobacterium sp. J367]MCR5877410.1 hypothetical protein [Phenylobacterium sp. J367]
MDDDNAPGLPAGKQKHVRWSEGLGEAICRRLRDGELLRHICQERDMPSDVTVANWARERPDFARALAAARRMGWRPDGAHRGPAFSFCPEIADEVFERLCEGESLTRIAADPTLPSLSTFYYWRRKIPEFEAAVNAARRIQADRFCDLGWALCEGATPETAYLTDVKLKQLRWMAGTMAPKTYRTKLVEPAETDEPMRIIWRHFMVEEDPETGERRLAVYVPDPETGGIMREDDPDYRPPRGLHMPGGVSW